MTGDSDSGGWAKPVRPVRFWMLVLPIAVAAAAVFVTSDIWSNARAVLVGWMTGSGERIAPYLLTAVAYVAGVIALRFVLGPPGATTMVADFGPFSMRWAVIGLVTGVALIVAETVTFAVAVVSGVELTPNPAQRMLTPLSHGELVVAFASAAVAGPYFEEMYFRGTMLSWLRDKIGIIAAVIVASALFGLAHLLFLTTPGAEGWIATGFLAAMGVVTSVLSLRSKSLWPAFAAHSAFNGITVVIWFLIPDAA